jgi:hypothetical protein
MVAASSARSKEVTGMRECSRFAGRFRSERHVASTPGVLDRGQDAAVPAIRITRYERCPHTRVASELTTLVRWILSLPWVTERAEHPQAPGVRWFAVDCDPLDRHRTWLLVGDIDWRGAADQTVTLVLPREVAHPLVAAGHAMLIAVLPSGHRLVSLSTPQSGQELELLRTLMLASYMGAFQ